jgi:iron complex outermembrane receptor protein
VSRTTNGAVTVTVPLERGGNMSLSGRECLLAFCMVGAASPAVAQVGGSETAGDAGADEALQEVVVTGVMIPQAPASIAVSTLNAAEIEQMVPISAADLLRNVPGVFVNTALGEIRNIVYSRGISANSVEAAGGYYYVSMQEDGLPVTNVTANNYGPDYFYRQDVNLARLEALRGGTATVTGPNAPGGIFNYISKTGKSDPGFEARARFGLEGDGRNPYYRTDLFGGGEIRDGLYYSIGGFYRRSDGPRDPTYAFNRGAQVKANLLWEYDGGAVQIYGKYLNDHNAWNEFKPAVNFNDPQLAPGISNYDSFLIPNAPHDYAQTLNGPTRHWDASQLAHNVSKVLGVKNEHEFGDGWSIRHNLKYASNKSDWNTSALVFPVLLTDAFTNVQLNATAPGTYTYRDLNTGALLAQVNLVGGVRTVVANNLPNQQVLNNGVLTQVAFDFHPHLKEWMDQLSLSKEFDRGSVTLGAFFADSDVSQSGGGSGIGLTPFQDQPGLIAITRTTATGVVQQVTSPEGFAGIGQRFGGNPFEANQRQISAFGGGDIAITDELKLDAAVRYDDIRVKGFNTVQVPNPNSANPAYGGLDGNPNTLYDNFAATWQSPFDYNFSLNYVSYSGALTYDFNDAHSVYTRYSRGSKAPNLQFFLTYDTLDELNNMDPIPQQIVQIEAGYRFRADRLRVTATPFYSKLSDVGTSQFGSNVNGTSYVPPILFAKMDTYGLELEADVDLWASLNLRTALTLQESKSKDFAIWVFNTPGPQDDTISRVPDGESDNNAKVMATTTLTYRPFAKFRSFLTWRHMGKRAANRYNAFDLPAFDEVDVGATFQVTDHLSIGANVNNAFNEEGVLGFAPGGTLLNALDRQALTPAQVQANPNQIFSILPNQPRSYFMTVEYAF